MSFVLLWLVIKDWMGSKQIGTWFKTFSYSEILACNFVEDISNSNFVILSGKEEYKFEGNKSLLVQMKYQRLSFRNVYHVHGLKKNRQLVSWLCSIAHLDLVFNNRRGFIVMGVKQQRVFPFGGWWREDGSTKGR